MNDLEVNEKIVELKKRQKAYRHKYYLANKDKINEKHKKYNQEHKEQLKQNSNNYRLKIKNRKIAVKVDRLWIYFIYKGIVSYTPYLSKAKIYSYNSKYYLKKSLDDLGLKYIIYEVSKKKEKEKQNG